jgi:hypothetical protein
LDEIKMIGSKEDVEVMKDIIMKNGVNKDVVNEWIIEL